MVTLGILSDTHGHVGYTRDAVQVLRRERIDLLLHCGDIGSHRIPSLLMEWPAHYVFGNVDYDEAMLRGAIRDVGGICHERCGDLTIAGCRIALLHSDDERKFKDIVESGKYDLVCYGHTHVARLDLQGRTRVLNPGALYRATPHQIAIVELPTWTIKHVVVSPTQDSVT
ncbi:MAG: YfcE family phosphodiesterase [Planctomycetaceae bacterium]